MKKILPYIFLSVTVLSGCKKFLTTSPTSFLSPDQYYTGSNLTNALAGVYNPLFQSSLYGNAIYTTLQACTDEGFYGGSSRSLTTGVAVYNFDYTNSDVNNFWTALYTGIERANELIAHIDTSSTAADVQAAYGEALFLRGYYHFMLVSNFGAVPLKTSATASADGLDAVRTPVKDVYAQIIKDMTAAEGKVHTLAALGYSSRVSKTAVEGVLARVCLTMAGSPLNDETQYANALSWAQKVVSAGGNALNTSYSQVFINEAKEVYDTKESIWEVDFSGDNLSTQQTAGRLGGNNGIAFTSAATYSNVTGSSDFIYLDTGYCYAFIWATKKLYDLYDVTDTRRDWNIGPFTYTVNTTTTAPTVYRVPITGTFAYNRPCAKWRRSYAPDNKNKNYTSVNFPLLRYSDILLMLAEAELHVNGSTATALGAINAVRERGYGLAGGAAPVKALTLLTAGSGYKTAPAVGSANLGSGIAYTATISSGAVTSVTLTSGGSGFSGTPIIYIGNPWTPKYYYAANAQVVYNGLLYTVTTAGASTTTPPTQTTGASSAATTGAVFTYAGVAATAQGSLLTTADVDLTVLTLQNIQDERARELCFEALRVPDLIRWGIFIPTMKDVYTSVMAYASFSGGNNQTQTSLGYKNIADRNTLLPIPSSELNVNKNMEQNPGW